MRTLRPIRRPQLKRCLRPFDAAARLGSIIYLEYSNIRRPFPASPFIAEQAICGQSKPVEDAVYGRIDEQFSPLQTRFPAMSAAYLVTLPASSNGSEGFVCRKRTTNPAALLFSLLVTAALIGMMLLVSGVADRVRPVAETLSIFTFTEVSDDNSKLPDAVPVNQPEVFADSPDEAAPSSRPRTRSPAPALPVVPPVAIDLAVEQQPQVPQTGEGLEAIAGANSKGDLAQGPLGRGGAGGDGLGGNGSGGVGSGKGEGSRLIASWAPGMDFSQNYRFYPLEARLAGIEGTAWLNCFVLPRDRVRDCKLVAERPSGHGFGKAALKTEKGLRVRVHTQSGRRIYNKWVIIESFFVLPPSEAGGARAEREGAPATAVP